MRERRGAISTRLGSNRRAFARTFAAALCLLSLTPGCNRNPSGAAADSHPAAEPVAAEPWFQDITAESGLDFTHLTGTNYFMPDQVGSGIALIDYDRDGRLDVYCVQNGGGGINRLFRQGADGRFEDVTETTGAGIAGRGMGAAAGDVNNDGWDDLVVTEYGRVRLLLNVGGKAFDQLDPRGGGVDNPNWAMPASFLDYDRDGWLDLVVGNYLDYDPTQVCYDAQGRQDFCAPMAFGGTVTRLWRNETPVAGGRPRWREVTAEAGLATATGAAMGLVCADFTGDGWPDIFCSDDGRPNRLFVNGGKGAFTEEAIPRGLAFNAMGATAANMGTAFGDADGDGLADLFVTHLAEEFHGFWKQEPRGFYMDRVASAGFQRQAWRGTGFGAVFADFDGDGHLDLAFANGLVRRATPGQTPVHEDVSPWWSRYAQRAQLFANEGGGRFRDVSSANLAFCGQAMVGRSLAMGDLDRDGKPDLIMGGAGGRVRVYRNVARRAGTWVGLRLIEPARGGRDAIGAELIVSSGARRWWAMIQPATSYLSSHDPGVLIGLGAATGVDGVEVRWADGVRERFAGLEVGAWQTLRRGEGTEP